MPKPKPAEISLTLCPMPGRYCVARMAPDASIPPDFFLADGFVSVTRTDKEVSLIYPEGRVADVQKCETGWVGFKVKGPLDFSQIGILARLSGALADAGVSLFALSTYDTDYLFVKADQEAEARKALASVTTLSD